MKAIQLPLSKYDESRPIRALMCERTYRPTKLDMIENCYVEVLLIPVGSSSA